MSKQVFIAPHKDIVASEAQELRRKIFSIIGDKPEKLVVDLEAVRVIDSIGLGVLISARNHLKKSGGELVVTNVSKEIAHLLKLGTDDLFVEKGHVCAADKGNVMVCPAEAAVDAHQWTTAGALIANVGDTQKPVFLRRIAHEQHFVKQENTYLNHG